MAPVLLLLLAALQGPPAPADPPERCGPDLSVSLYCLELFPTARAGEAAGLVELGRAPSPFTVAVTPDGHHEYELTAWLEGLPAPASLGPYTAYVAWVTPLELEPVVRLGEVGNGRNALGRVAFDKFLVMISAEASPDVTARDGPLVLRGRSPSSRLEAHDMLAQAPSAEQGVPAPAADRAEGGGAGHGGAAHGAGHGGHGAPGGWPRPPMYPDIPMLPGIMALEPGVDPLLPAPPGDPAALPEARPSRAVELPDGGTLDLTADYVRRRFKDRDVVMLAFNGQHPGPLLRVREASTIFVSFHNRTPFPTAIHWHGVRLDNRFDGVPGVTQEAIPSGGTFRYRVFFRDPGIYWYHPHHREDVQQELGLYGNMLVEARSPDYYGPANRDVALMLDDILLGDAGLLPFGADAATHALMGRFGDVVLVNGEPGYTLAADRGEVVRFHLTNASNTRTFNLSLVPAGGAEALSLKLVASDVGRFEREERVRSVVLAPAERYVVEARFEEAGTYELVNRVQAIDHRRGLFFPEVRRLGTVIVGDAPAAPDHGAAFRRLRVHDDVVADIDRYRPRFDDPPDLELDLSLETDGLALPIRDAMLYDRVYANPVEWAGTMPVMNWASTGREVRWILRDPATGRENMDIAWRFGVGDVVKIRIRNRRDVFHAMQHPLHIHGQRFLVIAQNGAAMTNLVWKDTVLLPAGSTTDILLELSNPGRWMVHCHIAEHLEAGMKFVLDVDGR